MTRTPSATKAVAPGGDLRQLDEWNRTDVDFGEVAFVHEEIERRAERAPESIALVFEGTSVSFGELDRRSNQLAHRLLRLGVGRGAIVAVFAERSIELVVALVSVLKTGAAYLPLDPENPRERLADMIDDAQPRVVLTLAGLRDAVPAGEATCVELDTEWDDIATESGAPTGVKVAGRDPACVIYTSGSTGRPKGVVNSHDGIRNHLGWMQQVFAGDASERVMQKTSVAFDVSLYELFWTLPIGGTLVIARPGGQRDPKYLLDLIEEQRITTLHFVPSMLWAFLDQPDLQRCASLRRVICSGEALTPDLVDRFFATMPCELHNLYGPTEAAVSVTAWECTSADGAASSVPIGGPVANAQIHILDEHGNRVPIGEQGELYIGGAPVALGYLNRTELTRERFVPDPFREADGARLYRTGDLARWRPDGAIEYLGRIDSQVKILGNRIELAEIEAVLRRHDEVRDCVASAVHTERGGLRLVAHVVPAAGTPPPMPELRSHAGRYLPGYMIPSVFIPLDEIPRNSSGKVDRKRLQARPGGGRYGEERVAPRSPFETRLAELFALLLCVPSVGIHDDFLASGGDSLRAARLLARVAEDFGVTVSLRTFYDNPTVAALAVIVTDLARSAGTAPLLHAVPGG